MPAMQNPLMQKSRVQHLRPSSAEGWLYYTVLYKGSEHRCILVSVGVLEPGGYQADNYIPKGSILSPPPVLFQFYSSPAVNGEHFAFP